MITWNENRTVATDENGNTATVKRWGCEENAVASLESNTGCHNCRDCSGCINCHDSTDTTCSTRCRDCTRCHDCTDSTRCRDSIRCHGCTRCVRSTECRDCSNCTCCTYCTHCTHCIDEKNEHGKTGEGHNPNLGNKMKITWNDDNTVATDENGNTATLEWWGCEEKAIASLGSNTGCHSCHDCSDCINCHDCARCTDCHGCTNCHDCHGCTNCSHCTRCHDCTDCTCCIGLTDENGKTGEGPEPEPDTTETKIRQVCSQLADFLCEKNQAYGDSALNPCRIFAKDVAADAQLRVRIDDKLNRLMKGSSYPGDNDTLDLAGYLVLALVQAGWEG